MGIPKRSDPSLLYSVRQLTLGLRGRNRNAEDGRIGRIGRIERRRVVLPLDGDREGSARHSKHNASNNRTLRARLARSFGFALGKADAVERVVGTGVILRSRGVCRGVVVGCAVLQTLVPLRVGHIGYADMPVTCFGDNRVAWQETAALSGVVCTVTHHATAQDGKVVSIGHTCPRGTCDIRGRTAIGPRPDSWGGRGRSQPRGIGVAVGRRHAGRRVGKDG